jgi:retinoblastoma-like protein 1
LCSGKKVNGKLNFDVVDDQVVARSLTDQNGASAAPVAVVGTKTPVKSEQADS